MRVLIVHNHYQNPGGEDSVVAAEEALLRHFGHDVLEYKEDNFSADSMNRLKLAANTIWSYESRKKFGEFIRRNRPDVVHFHNTFVMISPAAYYEAQRQGVPVVQTLHNYRLLCANGMFFRNEAVCEDCLKKSVAWPGLVHGCYRKSRVATGVVALMLAVHRSFGTWNRMVDVYITLTEFARAKFIQGGLPADKIVVKPNFIFPDPGFQPKVQGGFALFVGRLSPEKGADTLLAAWEKLRQRFPLKIVGDGPLSDRIVDAARRIPAVEYLGFKPPNEVYELMKKADFLVFPSKWYEGLPRTIIESYAVGTPVIASEHGSMSVVVKHNHTGLLFRPNDAEMLAMQVEWAFTHPSELHRMRRETRAEFESKYTAEQNYQKLMEIYQRAQIASHNKITTSEREHYH